ncbi:MAG TPA: tetratricopeptide repeat protein, partial [Gemmatimonadales bacterium]|nr:tetratricopeptide repeat protein [Gemmatimonadales bacterium]
MRSLVLAGVVAAGVAGDLAAQLAVQRPTEKFLMVPLPVRGGADSVTSIRVVDLTRERLDKLARYKVAVIPKQKICEALAASGFPCDQPMDQQQTRQLARFLDADAFLVGSLSREGGALTAHLRVVDQGGAGFAYTFDARDPNPGGVDGLSEAIAQRLNTIIRAGERARECEERRRAGQFSRALESARRALEIEPNLPAAHLCVATIYEAQRLGADSIIAAATRALKGDSLNGQALETIARQYQIKGDTAQSLAYFERLVRADPSNKGLLLGLVAQLQLRREFERAEALIRNALEYVPGDPQLQDRLYQLCIEGGRWRCVLEIVNERMQRDTALLGDTATIKVAIGAAQQLSDTQALLRYTGEATKRHPEDLSFMIARGSAFELAGRVDSAEQWYRRVAAREPGEVAHALRIAKLIVES